MLDRLTASPLFAFGFIFFVFILAIVYLVNRERAQVQRLKGPKRFQPRWTRKGRDRSRRRRSRSQGFKPDWTPRSGSTRSANSEGSPPGSESSEQADQDGGPDG